MLLLKLLAYPVKAQLVVHLLEEEVAPVEAALLPFPYQLALRQLDDDIAALLPVGLGEFPDVCLDGLHCVLLSEAGLYLLDGAQTLHRPGGTLAGVCPVGLLHIV